MDTRRFGAFLIARRVACGLRVTDIVRCAGLSLARYRRAEAGDTTLTRAELIRLASVLAVDEDVLACRGGYLPVPAHRALIGANYTPEAVKQMVSAAQAAYAAYDALPGSGEG